MKHGCVQVGHRERSTTTARLGAAASKLTRFHTVGSQEYRIGLARALAFFSGLNGPRGRLRVKTMA